MDATRRAVLAGGVAAVAARALGASPAREASSPSTGRVPGPAPAPGVAKAGFRIQKTLKYGMIGPGTTVLEKFEAAKAAGFAGVELDGPSDLKVAEVVEATKRTGMPVPSVIDSVHWSKTLGDADAAVRAEGLEGLKHAMRDAKAYGATSVLLVPAVVNAKVSYADAYKRSQEEVRKAIPLAEELNVTIAFENVWNNFLLSPLEAARYVDEFNSKHIGWHFDIGNIVNYGWPAQWIRTLGPRIVKLDIKGFSRKLRDDKGLWKGFEAQIADPDDDCDHPAMRAALAEIGYNGWASAEVGGGDLDRLKDISRRMDIAFGPAVDSTK